MLIYGFEDTIEKLNRIRKSKKIVFMSGVFDLFHYGHFKALLKASKMGDIFVVQIDGNRLVRKRKGVGRPYIDQKLRASIVSSLKFVDFVYISNRPSEDKEILKNINPSIFIRAIKPDENISIRRKREKDIMKHMKDGKIYWLKQTPEISTTKVISVVGNSYGKSRQPRYKKSINLYYKKDYNETFK